MSKKENKKLTEAYAKLTIRCKCGHSIIITKQNPVKICSHCGNIVYRDPREYFKWKLNSQKKALKKD